MQAVLTSFVSGLLFGGGLILSGMIDAANVLAFFDVAGEWNPSLAFVMAGGLAVTWGGYVWALRRAAPLCEPRFQIPTSTRVDARLVAGSAIFGLGWGLAGYCPGPALAAAGGGVTQAAIFLAAMLAGMMLWRVVESAQSRA